MEQFTGVMLLVIMIVLLMFWVYLSRIYDVLKSIDENQKALLKSEEKNHERDQ